MPRMRHSTILMLAIGSGFAAFVLSIRMFSNGPSEPAEVNRLMVVGAAQELDIGTTIKSGNVELVQAPRDIDPKILYTDFDDVIGSITRTKIHAGDPIRSNDLVAEGDNLASLIPEGYRAMTIPVVLPSELSNLIQVGNRVDVLLTYEVARGQLESVTLVENAKVIGVSDTDKKTATMGRKELFITLAVTPKGAETLAYSMKKGTLTVTVRSSLDSESGSERFFSLKDLFFKEEPESVAKKMEESGTIEIIRGVHKDRYSANEERY